MAQVPCIPWQDDETLDYTPDSDVAIGTVVVRGDRLVTITDRAILSGELGGTVTEGIWIVPKVTGALSDGDELYWDDNADPVGGDAGSGAFTSDSSKGPFAGWCIGDAASGDATCKMLLAASEDATTTLRSSLGQDDLAPYNIPITLLQATGTGAQLGSSAGTPSGAMGLTVGSFGTATPMAVGEAASGNSKTDKARFQFRLPAEYVSGETITLRVRAKATGTINTAKTVDAECYLVGDGVVSGSDLCATSAQSVTTSFANYDFTITPTSRAAGELLDVQLTVVADDTGGSNNKLVEICAIWFLLDIKG